MNNKQEIIAAFVRGFFLFLERSSISSVILHGGQDSFEKTLTDVDFAISHKNFLKLAILIHTYCEQSGWRMCQILRHETTAAYFVCAANDDPSCVVALDACSDYQRFGTLYLRDNCLLNSRIPLDWGGFCLQPDIELCYRFAKAAAKCKAVDVVTEEFLKYPDTTRKFCSMWLLDNWGVVLSRWEKDSIESALIQLRRKSNLHPPLFQASALYRILKRVAHPTGLIVVTGEKHFETSTSEIKRIYGELYFRRFKKINKWNLVMIKDLISSTLIILPELPPFFLKIIPKNCVINLELNKDYNSIAKKLHARCVSKIAIRDT